MNPPDPVTVREYCQRNALRHLVATLESIHAQPDDVDMKAVRVTIEQRIEEARNMLDYTLTSAMAHKECGF